MTRIRSPKHHLTLSLLFLPLTFRVLHLKSQHIQRSFRNVVGDDGSRWEVRGPGERVKEPRPEELLITFADGDSLNKGRKVVVTRKTEVILASNFFA